MDDTNLTFATDVTIAPVHARTNALARVVIGKPKVADTSRRPTDHRGRISSAATYAIVRGPRVDKENDIFSTVADPETGGIRGERHGRRNYVSMKFHRRKSGRPSQIRPIILTSSFEVRKKKKRENCHLLVRSRRV